MTGKHILTEIDEETKTAYCQRCDRRVEVRYKSHNGVYRWRCRVALRAQYKKERERKKPKINGIWLYKAFDSNNVLLYVGITNQISIRFKRHQKESIWWTSHTRMELIEVSSREDAENLERGLIKTENPVFNILYN